MTAREVAELTVRRLGLATLALALALAAAATGARAADTLVEDWARQPLGALGVPDGWKGQDWGKPSYDFTIAAHEGRRVLHLRSRGDSSTIARELGKRVSLRDTPVLEWSWRVVTLPAGADSRRKAADDQAAQVYVIWRRFPESVRSQVIGYVWDTAAPAGTTVQSQKTRTVTYVVVRSGPGELGRWLTERRNVRDDYRRIFGEEPWTPDAVALGIDSNDTGTSAESMVGTLRFVAP